MSMTPKGPAVAYGDHDPYCIEADLCGQCDVAVCICWVIAKVRADERERVAADTPTDEGA